MQSYLRIPAIVLHLHVAMIALATGAEAEEQEWGNLKARFVYDGMPGAHLWGVAEAPPLATQLQITHIQETKKARAARGSGL